MPGHNREDRKRLPEFYVSPAVRGLAIEPEVRAALEELWPWFWNYVRQELGDAERAAEMADEVAYGVSKYVQEHRGEIRSFVGLCRVAAVNFIATIKTREGRIEYLGLSQDIEATLGPRAPDWRKEVEVSIWIDQVLRGHDREIRTMLELRLLNQTWDEIGHSLGLTPGQARLRFRRAVGQIQDGVIFPGPDRGRS